MTLDPNRPIRTNDMPSFPTDATTVVPPEEHRDDKHEVARKKKRNKVIGGLVAAAAALGIGGGYALSQSGESHPTADRKPAATSTPNPGQSSPEVTATATSIPSKTEAPVENGDVIGVISTKGLRGSALEAAKIVGAKNFIDMTDAERKQVLQITKEDVTGQDHSSELVAQNEFVIQTLKWTAGQTPEGLAEAKKQGIGFDTYTINLEEQIGKIRYGEGYTLSAADRQDYRDIALRYDILSSFGPQYAPKPTFELTSTVVNNFEIGGLSDYAIHYTTTEHQQAPSDEDLMNSIPPSKQPLFKPHDNVRLVKEFHDVQLVNVNGADQFTPVDTN